MSNHHGGIAHHGAIAERYHAGGVIGDEVPITARKGEGVFTPEQMKAMGAAMGGNRAANSVKILNLSDPRAAEKEITANPEIILNFLARNSTAARQAMSQ